MTELHKQYDPEGIEADATRRWLDSKAFAATPDERRNRYVIMMPLPNVTGALHMGHAMDNVMQDMLTRWHRMLGDNTLWMAGTDHAGIGTQAVIEKRLLELEGKSRHDVGREALVQRIWEWKDQYQERIVRQQQAMGCSCDWDRQRFTMDAVCARAVRHTFFRMFAEGLIYQGDRLVNWDCHLQTAVADDELYRETVRGHFWHLRYPVIDPRPGEPDHVVVATTRPETMLGDTAVACHPRPVAALDGLITEAEQKVEAAGEKDRADAVAELERLRERKATRLDHLEQIAAMARDGRSVMLPLMERPIPIILDEWAKPELGSGCVKITPGHDPNDYDVWTRHKDRIGIVNILRPDGTLNENAGAYADQDRFTARDNVVRDLEARGLIAETEEREIEIDHSDRSKTIIEPYVSKQWFVRMGDVDAGVVLGRGTAKEFEARGLAQAAIDAADGQWRSMTGRSVRFWPDQDRYHKMYHTWLAEKRDWCISRQLWWGHRIPVWSVTCDRDQLLAYTEVFDQIEGREDVAIWVVLADDARVRPAEALERAGRATPETATMRVLFCAREPRTENDFAGDLEALGFTADPDVLDTWFSSALWPHSTLGWPDPETARVGPEQSPLGSRDGHSDCLSYYYPGSCLVTGRDIITLWVARMVVMGLYNLGDVPFTDVFLHANILDGKGVRMSKSKGNGIDPLDIIHHYGADALRYVLCEMQTGTQDIRLPVQVVSPFDGELIDMANAQPADKQGVFIDPRTDQEFDVVGLYENEGVPQGKATSDRFEVGRNFCNKLWNAARFAFMNLEGTTFEMRARKDLALEDRWILSRLTNAVTAVQTGLLAYNASAALTAARDFFWNELCDWYLELIKPRMKDPQQAPIARQVLATCLDQVLRVLHPFVPFISEVLWQRLGELAPQRGTRTELTPSPLLVHAKWPVVDPAWLNEALEQRVAFVQSVVTSIREVRARYQVPPSTAVPVVVKAAGSSAEALAGCEGLIATMANASSVEVTAAADKPKDAATAVVRDVEAYVLGVVDAATEKAKLEKQAADLRGRITGVQKKLSNEGFLQKAPEQVVAGERARLADLEQQLQSVEATLAEL